MFMSCLNRGFRIGFANGYEVSCQFGKNHYCERRSHNIDELIAEERFENPERMVISHDCEIAIMKRTNAQTSDEFVEFVTKKVLDKMGFGQDDYRVDDMVAGYITADEVAKILSYVQGLEA